MKNERAVGESPLQADDACYKHKCRRCGEIFGDIHSGGMWAMGFLLNCIRDGVHKGDGGQVSMIEVHCCEDGSLGVADLIGVDLTYRVASVEVEGRDSARGQEPKL